MASPQWKNFQPPNEDSAISSFQCSPSFSKTSNGNHMNLSQNHSTGQNSASSSGNLRETGVVEKLLHSYGFIQCCERQARLFFHYSQYSGNIEHLKLGDPVEFEMTYDRRTGKPIASAVTRISPEAGEVLSEERVSGFITTEIKDGMEGRVAYESRGECFFLPYGKEDLESDTELHPHDKVTFHIATDKKTGNLRARNIRLEQPLGERYQGVICALKETFGFIERADVVKEIFFHSSECKDFKNLNLGDDVEFSVHIRNNKEVAVNIVLLPLGTVVFEDVDTQVMVGQVTKVLEKDRSKQPSDALSGKIQCQRDENTVVEYPYGERDPKLECTLQVGDWVQFNIATDRRDNLQRATNIELMVDTFTYSGEKREQGVVIAVKETFGFIKYGSRDTRLYFRLSELMSWDPMVKVQDEVEFTVAQDPMTPSRSQAIRIRILPPGTIAMNSSSSNRGVEQEDDKNTISGVVEKAASSPWSSKSPQKVEGKSGNRETEEQDLLPGMMPEDGIISFYNKDGVKEKVSFALHDCQNRHFPHVGDKVEFVLSSKNGDTSVVFATSVRVIGNKVRNGMRYTHRGFIAALKESFGFIETEEHDREVFFHFSVFEGSTSSLEVGQEVEYGLMHKGTKMSAECVRKLSSGTIPPEDIKPEILNGVVVNPVRCFNPDQDSYSGRIRLTTDAENPEGNDNLTEYEFGITSLNDKHEFLQKGDVVQFQIGVTSKGQERAVNIKSIRTRVQATVDTIKGHFGFLSYEAEEGKKLFFHMSEVKDGSLLQPGDKVEFVVLHHQKTGKYSACSVVKVGDGQPSQRPERLISRLRTLTSEDGGPRLVVCRQPRGPDGTEGFKLPRQASPKADGIDGVAVNGIIPDMTNGNCYVNFGGGGDDPLEMIANHNMSSE